MTEFKDGGIKIWISYLTENTKQKLNQMDRKQWRYLKHKEIKFLKIRDSLDKVPNLISTNQKNMSKIHDEHKEHQRTISQEHKNLSI